MYRFFVPFTQIQEKSAVIRGDDVNHIRNVLRMERGEELVISAGRGVDYVCRIEEILPEQIELEIWREEPVRTELPVRLVLFQALPKADKMEWIIQKAVELGVQEIVPVRTKRCVVRLDEKKAVKKRERWQGIAEAAAKQSGRGIVPQVRDVMNFEEALREAEELECTLIPYELFDDMKNTAEQFSRAAASSSVGIFIGPEGGFERGEVEMAIQQGTSPVSLGKRILRTETAGLMVLSVLMFQIEGGID